MKTIFHTTLFLAFSSVLAAAGVGCGFQTPAGAPAGETVGVTGLSSGQTARVSIHSTALDPAAAFVSFHSAEGCLLKSERVLTGGGKIATVDLTGYEIAAATGSLRSQVVASVAFEAGQNGSAMTLGDVTASIEIFHSGTGDTVALIRGGRELPPPAQKGEDVPGAYSKQPVPAPSNCTVELERQEAKLKQFYESKLQKAQADAEKALLKLEQESKSKIRELETKVRELESKLPPPTSPKPGDGASKPPTPPTSPKPGDGASKPPAPPSSGKPSTGQGK